MSATPDSSDLTEDDALPIRLSVTCSDHLFARKPVRFDRWANLNYLVGPNGSGKTTVFNGIMAASRSQWPNRVKILGTGRLGPLEKSVTQWVGDTASRLFQEENIDVVYSGLFSGQDTAHQAFQLLEKRLDLQIRVLGFLRHVFKKTIHFKPSRKGLQVLGASDAGASYQIIDECHGLKELITILTFLYDETFSVLGIDEPELHLHPQFQRFLLDELRAVAGDPAIPGKKLIFLVTHSPILLELRTLSDLASIVMFSHSAPPQRASPWRFSPAEKLKVKQALPSFHAGQRELLFSNVPIVLEGPFDVSVLMNTATRLSLPLGAAGIGLTSMGGKYQLLAYRALLGSLIKPEARFVLDLDAVTDAKAIHCLDSDPRVAAHLESVGVGDRSLTKVVGELIGLIRSYSAEASSAGTSMALVVPQSTQLSERDLAINLRVIKETAERDAAKLFSPQQARTILGKLELVRAAARAANVLILSKGAIEAYYERPLSARPTDFEKQQALQEELDAIWRSDPGKLESRYDEVLRFFSDAGFLRVPLADLTREPVANLIHLLQTEILTGRVRTLEEGRRCPRAIAEGYWYICDLVSLQVRDNMTFSGEIRVKQGLGEEVFHFDNDTRAYELTVAKPSEAAAHGAAADGTASRR